ncbi:MAG TPA: asparagine synthase (glutamine-hydrolyzing), partial [Kofleriaceae bacterium]|nr:asparagine synthase (glutamine-hydrolyzing) [Kofleriaceae bacterium]
MRDLAFDFYCVHSVIIAAITMCGIAGIVSRAEPPGDDAHGVRAQQIGAMVGALHHRGPDGRGTYFANAVALGHTRLAIIDPAGGAQPMHLADGHGGSLLSLVFNGEIYNYVELREELRLAGHVFETRSDTEVVLHAFAAWGDDAITRFNGQWALGLWDARRRRLLLCRDRIGINPLYYAESPARVMFASEVKALFAGDPALRAGLDPIGLDQTLTFWAAIAPRTVFRGISELPPGHVRVYERGEVTERAYFEHNFTQSFTGSLAEAEEAVRAALERATALRMLRADVPVGCYLSGGLDSSLVAALGLRAKGERFHTFSLRFADAEYDESAYQQLVVRALGTEHHEVVVGRDDIARAFPAVVRHAERPLLRTAPAPLFLLSKLVADVGIKVVLTGEGADEMFAGYDLFREGVIRRFWAREPSSKRRALLLQRLYPYLARSPAAFPQLAMQFFGSDLASAGQPGFTHGTRWRTTSALKRLVAPSHRPPAGTDVVAALLADVPAAFPRWTPLAQDQYLEIRTLLGPYLIGSQGDRMLMAHSVEGRFPFLDPDVVDLAHRLPDAAKLRVLDEKHVLKRVAASLVPQKIIARSKQPYRAPDALSFVSPAASAEIDELLSEHAVSAGGVLDPQAVGTLWRKCKASAGRGVLSNTDNMTIVFA